MEETLITQLRTNRITYEEYRIKKAIELRRFIDRYNGETAEAYEIYLEQKASEHTDE